MKKIYSLLALLLLTLGNATAYAQSSDWTNKYISSVSEAASTLEDGKFYLAYNTGRGTWLYENGSNLTLGAVSAATSGASSSVKPTLANVQSAFQNDPSKMAYVIKFVADGDSWKTQFRSGNYMQDLPRGGQATSGETPVSFTLYSGTDDATLHALTQTSSNGYSWNGNGYSFGDGGYSFTGWDAANTPSLGGNNTYLFYPVTLAESYTITYIGKDSNDNTIYTSSKELIPGAEFPTVPSSVDGFYEITGESPTGTVSATATYTFTFSQADTDAPQISSSATADDATWYGIKARDTKPLIALSQAAQSGIYCNPFESYKITSMFQSAGASLTYDDVKNAQLWCITGDPFNGFRFINKWNKAAIAVGSSSADGQNAVMRLITTNDYSLFDITKADGKFQAQVHGGTQYLSDWGGDSSENFKFYSVGAASDGGSALTFTENGVTDITTSNIEAAEIYSNHGWVGDTYATITVPESTSNTGEDLFNEVFSANTVAIESGKYYKIYCNRSDAGTDDYETTTDNRYVSTETSAFHTDGTLTVDNYDDSTYPRTLTRVPASGAEVPKLWQFEEQSTAGTYKIRNANTGRCWSNSTGSAIDQPISDDNAGVFTPTAVSGVAETWQLVYGSTHYVNAYGGMDKTAVQNYDSSTDKGGYWAFIPVTTIPLIIYNDTQYASACYPFAVELPTGLTAYAISSTTASEATLTEIGSVVPAKTPVFIAAGGDATATSTDDTNGTKTYTLTISSSTDTYSGTNRLLGATVARVGFEESANYVLAAGPKLKSTGTVTKIPANKAYLPASSVPSAAQALSLSFGETTGISTISTNNVSEESNVYYDLNGRRVLYPVHGIFVKGNGQKVYIK